MNDKASKTSRSTRKPLVIVFTVIFVGIAGWYLFSSPQTTTVDAGAPVVPETLPEKAPEETTSEEVTVNSQDEQYKDKLVGTWVLEKNDKKTLDLKQDGTGTLTIESQSFQAMLIGEVVVLNIEWNVKEGHAQFVSLSGKPEAAFKTIKGLYGTTLDRIIKELDTDKMVLLDDKDKSESTWDRTTTM